MTLGDRIAGMNDGELHQVDTPEQIYHKQVRRGLYRKPTDEFPRRKPSQPGRGCLAVETDEVTFDLPTTMPISNSPEVVVSIRLQKLELRDEAADATPRIHGEITAMEPVGENMTIHIDTGIREIRVVEDKYMEYDVGDVVTVTFDPSETHYFNAKTRDRILV